MTNDGIQHLIASLEGEHDSDSLRAIFSGYINRYGFNAFTYAGLRFPTRDILERPVVRTFPIDWVDHYERELYESIDPVLSRAVSSLVPIVWDRFVAHSDVSGKQKRIFDEAKEFGLLQGVTVPIHGQLGEFAILSMAGEQNDKDYQGIIQNAGHELHLAALYYHEAVRKHLTSPKRFEEYAQLSAREKECLVWAARGKTAWETSEILKLSENTVNFYIKNAMKKLGVFNKQHAIVTAIMNYMILP